jgi:hypothetical protein
LAASLSAQQPSQLTQHQRRRLEHVSPGVAAELVPGGANEALPPPILLPGVAGAVVVVGVELDDEPVRGPAAIEAAAAEADVGVGEGEVVGT